QPIFFQVTLRQRRQLLISDQNVATRGMIDTAESIEQGRFATTRGSHQRYRIAGTDLPLDSFDGSDLLGRGTIGFSQLRDLNFNAAVLKKSVVNHSLLDLELLTFRHASACRTSKNPKTKEQRDGHDNS